MKYDENNCLIRDAGTWPGNCGDSAADTARLAIMGSTKGDLRQFIYANGFLRHPSLHSTWGGIADFSNDQLVPLMLARILEKKPIDKAIRFPFIFGTKTLAQPAVYAILWRQWWLLDLMNRAQGFLLGLPFRWSDDESEGMGFRSSIDKVQDYLNMIAIYVFLKKIGYQQARLPRPLNECVDALILYRTGKVDPEPNWEWEMQFYLSAIGSQVVLKKD